MDNHPMLTQFLWQETNNGLAGTITLAIQFNHWCTVKWVTWFDPLVPNLGKEFLMEGDVIVFIIDACIIKEHPNRTTKSTIYSIVVMSIPICNLTAFTYSRQQRNAAWDQRLSCWGILSLGSKKEGLMLHAFIFTFETLCNHVPFTVDRSMLHVIWCSAAIKLPSCRCCTHSPIISTGRRCTWGSIKI